MKMRIITNIKIYAVLIATLFMASCDKEKVIRTLGDNLVYMPQAAYSDKIYPVPSGLDMATFNYSISNNGKLNIVLGVMRSGSHPAKDYSVTVSSLTDTVTALIQNGIYPEETTVVLPADAFELPTIASVTNNNYGTTFLLSVDIDKLKSFSGKNVLLGVGITKATAYAINPHLHKVVVVINVDELDLN